MTDRGFEYIKNRLTPFLYDIQLDGAETSKDDFFRKLKIILDDELKEEWNNEKISSAKYMNELEDCIIRETQTGNLQRESIIKLIENKQEVHEAKYKEFVNETRNVMNGHWIKAETCKEIIQMIKNNSYLLFKEDSKCAWCGEDDKKEGKGVLTIKILHENCYKSIINGEGII